MALPTIDWAADFNVIMRTLTRANVEDYLDRMDFKELLKYKGNDPKITLAAFYKLCLDPPARNPTEDCIFICGLILIRGLNFEKMIKRTDGNGATELAAISARYKIKRSAGNSIEALTLARLAAAFCPMLIRMANIIKPNSIIPNVSFIAEKPYELLSIPGVAGLIPKGSDMELIRSPLSKIVVYYQKEVRRALIDSGARFTGTVDPVNYINIAIQGPISNDTRIEVLISVGILTQVDRLVSLTKIVHDFAETL